MGLGSVANPAIAFDAAEARRVARSVLSDGTYQTTLPTGDLAPAESDNFLVKLFRRIFEPLLNFGGKAIHPVLRVIGWTAVLVGGTLLIFFLANELPVLLDRWLAPARAAGRDGMRPGEGPAFDSAGTLADADRLAAERDFAAAIRILLFRGLMTLRERIDETAFPFLTSRELLDLASMSERARAALAAIVTTEELGHFGGRRLDARTYDESRRNFLRFAEEFSKAAP